MRRSPSTTIEYGGGLPLVSAAETLGELAADLALIDLVVVLDSALRLGTRSGDARDRALARADWQRYGYSSTDIELRPGDIIGDAESALGLLELAQRRVRWQRQAAMSRGDCVRTAAASCPAGPLPGRAADRP